MQVMSTDTFQMWAQEHADELGLPGDLFAVGDPYDIIDDAETARYAGVDPRDFVEAVFAEELSRMENDRQEAREAEEQS